MKGLFNTLKAIIGLLLIGIGWYSLTYGFTSTNGDGNFFFIGGFLMGGIGVTILIYWYNISKSMNDLIIVKAKITMKTTEEGGRQFGFKSGYRPNHVFELPKDLRNITTYIGDIQFEDQELIEPGETKIVTVRFLNVPEVQKFITVGQKWFINEAAITLGFGEILEI